MGKSRSEHVGGVDLNYNANSLVVPSVKLSTVGSRAFVLAAPHICNTLPTDVVAASSLSSFRRLLERFLFKQSYPDIIS